MALRSPVANVCVLDHIHSVLKASDHSKLFNTSSHHSHKTITIPTLISTINTVSIQHCTRSQSAASGSHTMDSACFFEKYCRRVYVNSAARFVCPPSRFMSCLKTLPVKVALLLVGKSLTARSHNTQKFNQD